MDANDFRSKLETSDGFVVLVAEFVHSLVTSARHRGRREMVRLQLVDGELEFSTENVSGA